MPYAFDNGIVTTQSLEYSVAYHCNLRCAGCSHLSPFAPAAFPSLRSFVSDLACLGTALRQLYIMLLRQHVHTLEADVVPVVGISPARIAQTNDDLHFSSLLTGFTSSTLL